MRKAKFIVLHCSNSDVLVHNDVNIIKKWHQAKGWRTVGYHYFIQKNGSVQSGRALDEDTIIEADEIGAHTIGVNDQAVGICLHGRKEFTHDQWRSLAKLCRKLMQQFGLEPDAIKGHNEFPSAIEKGKTCPNFNVDTFKWLFMGIKKTKKDGKGNSGPGKGDKPGNKAGFKGNFGKKQKGSADPSAK